MKNFSQKDRCIFEAELPNPVRYISGLVEPIYVSPTDVIGRGTITTTFLPETNNRLWTALLKEADLETNYGRIGTGVATFCDCNGKAKAMAVFDNLLLNSVNYGAYDGWLYHTEATWAYRGVRFESIHPSPGDELSVYFTDVMKYV